MIPYTPEPIGQLRARYQAAITRVYDGAKVASGEEEMPSKNRAHIFDYNENELGFRFIVSREIDPRHGLVIHFSVSVISESRLLKVGRSGGIDPNHLEAAAVMVFQTISEDYREPRFAGFSEKGVGNWMILDELAGNSQQSDSTP